MHLVLSILSAGVIVSSLVLNKPEFGERVGVATGATFSKSEVAQLVNDHSETPLKLNNQEKNSGGKILIKEDADESAEDVDFDEDEFDDASSERLLGVGSVASLMHVHQERGEVLVPCFGMWWPVGGYYGGGGGYEYIDYYGDYKKKRRRSRKQKKAAKMKRKKS